MLHIDIKPITKYIYITLLVSYEQKKFFLFPSKKTCMPNVHYRKAIEISL